MKGNWIKLHRSILDHWISGDLEEFAAWVRILLRVNHAPGQAKVRRGAIIEVGRGQSALSLDSWAKDFGPNWNKSRVRRFFKMLEKANMIRTESATQTTLLTVLNYDSYQESRHASETQAKREAAGSRHPADTKQEYTKNGQEGEEAEEASSEPINELKAAGAMVNDETAFEWLRVLNRMGGKDGLLPLLRQTYQVKGRAVYPSEIESQLVDQADQAEREAEQARQNEIGRALRDEPSPLQKKIAARRDQR